MIIVSHILIHLQGAIGVVNRTVTGSVAELRRAAVLFERFTLYRTGEGGYHGRRIPALITTQPGTILAFNGGPARH